MIKIKKSYERIYTIVLDMYVGRTSASISVITESVSQDVYKKIFNNLESVSRRGKIELGLTSTDGVRARYAVSEPKFIASGLDYVKSLGEEIINSGIKGDTNISSKPRKDLLYSFNHLTYWIDSYVPTNDLNFLYHFNIIDLLEGNYKGEYQLMKNKLNSSRLIPLNYEARVRGV